MIEMLLLSKPGGPLRKATNTAARIAHRHREGDNFGWVADKETHFLPKSVAARAYILQMLKLSQRLAAFVELHGSSAHPPQRHEDLSMITSNSDFTLANVEAGRVILRRPFQFEEKR